MPDDATILSRNSSSPPFFKSPKTKSKETPRAFPEKTKQWILDEWNNVKLTQKLYYILDLGSACGPEIIGVFDFY